MESNNFPFFSETGRSYPASGIRKMFNLASQYSDIVNLTVGEPNFDTPEHIRAAAVKALNGGYTHYSPNAGLPVLREAVAEHFQHYQAGFTADNVIISVGALEALTLALITTVGPGDEVLVPDPYFPNYLGQVMLAGAKAVCVPIYEENEHRLQAVDIEKAITPRRNPWWWMRLSSAILRSWISRIAVSGLPSGGRP
ncbi:hypothetical protein FACS189468_9270 [Spirochaetia bacterium]|nr:hypothetical protein FACS189468_9270 [Spirochaetia bacterium]